MSRDKIRELCQRAKRSSRELALIGTAAKDRALRAMARSLVSGCGKIVRENEKDVAAAEGKGLKSSLVDRLRLDRAGVAAMADSLAAIASLKDPVGQTIERRLRPNGLKIEKVRVPIGVILIIYESRPNVTSDCAGLCLKSSNAIILRGGSEAIRSNIAIFDILRAQAVRNGLPADCISMIRDTDRRVVEALLKHEGLIDLVIPRGGESLIREVARKSRIPVIKHYKGVCNTYVDAGADLRMAESICYNAKVQRPGVCNAMETMLVHRSVAADFLPGMIRSLRSAGVEIRGCAETRRIVRGVRRATEDDWYSEYLDLVL